MMVAAEKSSTTPTTTAPRKLGVILPEKMSMAPNTKTPIVASATPMGPVSASMIVSSMSEMGERSCAVAGLATTSATATIRPSIRAVRARRHAASVMSIRPSPVARTPSGPSPRPRTRPPLVTQKSS